MPTGSTTSTPDVFLILKPFFFFFLRIRGAAQLLECLPMDV